ncbi:hypothetical protein ACET3Z_012243 [Daucus carota]
MWGRFELLVPDESTPFHEGVCGSPDKAYCDHLLYVSDHFLKNLCDLEQYLHQCDFRICSLTVKDEDLFAYLWRRDVIQCQFLTLVSSTFIAANLCIANCFRLKSIDGGSLMAICSCKLVDQGLRLSSGEFVDTPTKDCIFAYDSQSSKEPKEHELVLFGSFDLYFQDKPSPWLLEAAVAEGGFDERRGIIFEEATGLVIKFIIGRIGDKAKVSELVKEVAKFDDFMLLVIKDEYRSATRTSQAAVPQGAELSKNGAAGECSNINETTVTESANIEKTTTGSATRTSQAAIPQGSLTGASQAAIPEGKNCSLAHDLCF